MIYWGWEILDLENNMLAQDLKSIQSQGVGSGVPADVGGIIDAILPFVFYGAGIALLVYLIMGGLQLMLAKGDPKAIQGAQGKITNAIIGFVLVVFAYSITKLVGEVLNISQFSLIFK